MADLPISVGVVHQPKAVLWYFTTVLLSILVSTHSMLTCIYKSGVNCSIFDACIDQNCKFMNPVQKNLDITRYYNYRKGREGREGWKKGKGRKRKGRRGREGRLTFSSNTIVIIYGREGKEEGREEGKEGREGKGRKGKDGKKGKGRDTKGSAQYILKLNQFFTVCQGSSDPPEKIF